MDPNACLARFIAAYDEYQKYGSQDDATEATEAWADLHNWIARKGFHPNWEATKIKSYSEFLEYRNK